MTNLLWSTLAQRDEMSEAQQKYRSSMDQLRHIWVKKQTCENVEELIKSKDFRRWFIKVLNLHPKYNRRRIVWILNKLKHDEILNDKDQEELMICISDPDVIRDAKAVQNRLMGFTARNAAKFLEQYPVSKILKHLQSYITDEIRDVLQVSWEHSNTWIDFVSSETNLSSQEYSIERTAKLAGDQYLLLKIPEHTIHNPSDNAKWCWKKRGELIFAHDFQYDFIEGVSEFGDTLETAISKVRIWSKRAYRSVADLINYDADADAFFDDVSWIKEVDNTIIYEAKENDKVGYIRLWKEKNDRPNIVFDGIEEVRTFAGRLFYTAHNNTNTRNSKRGHFSLETPITDSDVKRLQYDIGDIEQDDKGNIYYPYIIKNVRTNTLWFVKKRNTKKHIFFDAWWQENNDTESKQLWSDVDDKHLQELPVDGWLANKEADYKNKEWDIWWGEWNEIDEIVKGLLEKFK